MKVIWDGLILRATLASGAGDNLLTIDPTTGEVTSIAGTPLTTSLTDGYIYVGNASNVATGVPMSGDVTISNTGVAAIGTGVIVNADVNASAAIALTKLAASTANKAASFGATGFLEPATTTLTELNYSSGLTGNIQAQLATKQATITGAASTVTSSNLSANFAVISNASGKIAVSPTTSTELSYVSGVTSNIQGQLNTKLTTNVSGAASGDILYYNGSQWVNLARGTTGQVLTATAGSIQWSAGTSTGIPSGGTAGQYLNKIDGTDYNAQWSDLTLDKITDVTALAADVNILSGLDALGLTGVELGYSIGVTSAIQDQLDNKLGRALGYNNIWVGNGAGIAAQFAPGIDGDVLTMVGGALVWQTPTPPGDVSGPGSSTDRAIATWNGIAGDALYDNTVFIDASGNITDVTSLRTKNQGGIILRELTANGTNAVTLRAHGTMGADYTITLPAAAPGVNTYLQYDGADYVWAAGGGGGAVDFTDLGDVPATYVGQALKLVRVNAGETGLEFLTPPYVTSVTGTANRITSTGGLTPVIDISASYVGQATITTLGTVGTGTWNATNISLAKGGTGATLADPGADRMMFWDESSNQVTWLSAGTGLAISGTSLDADISIPGYEYFAGDGITTVFTLSEADDLAIIFVEVGGVINEEGVDYTKDNITKEVTFTTAPSALQRIGVYYVSNLIATAGVATWGGITGTITDQTDLVSYIDDQRYTIFKQFTTATSTTAYTGTPNPTISAYSNYQVFQVKAHATSTGLSTLNLAGLGAKKMYTTPTTQATTGDVVINTIYFFIYDSTLDGGSGGFIMIGGSGGGLTEEQEDELEMAYTTSMYLLTR